MSVDPVERLWRRRYPPLVLATASVLALLTAFFVAWAMPTFLGLGVGTLSGIAVLLGVPMASRATALAVMFRQRRRPAVARLDDPSLAEARR